MLAVVSLAFCSTCFWAFIAWKIRATLPPLLAIVPGCLSAFLLSDRLRLYVSDSLMFAFALVGAFGGFVYMEWRAIHRPAVTQIPLRTWARASGVLAVAALLFGVAVVVSKSIGVPK